MGIKSFFIGVTFAVPVTGFIGYLMTRASDPETWKTVVDSASEKASEYGPSIIDNAANHIPVIMDKLGL